MRMGRAYELDRQIVVTPVKALNAALEPKYIRPSRHMTVVDRMKAGDGAVARKGVGASTGGCQGTDTCEHQDSQDQK